MDVHEGEIFICKHKNSVGIVALKVQTDFSSRNELFLKLGNALAQHCMAFKVNEVEKLKQFKYADISHVSALEETIAVLKENIVISECGFYHDNVVNYYLHQDKKACIVCLKNGVEKDAYDIAVQVVSMPSLICLSRDDCDKELLKQFQEETKIKHKGKPQHIIEKIVESSTLGWYKEHTLMESMFYLDSTKSVSTICKERNNCTINSFKVYEL
jgi:translation elongation factor EF-Ts